jgi:hypothetical protein
MAPQLYRERVTVQKPNRASYTAAEFLDWSTTKALVLTPKFQRRGVWKPAARSFFIDSLLREMPVPAVYLRLGQSEKKDKVVREVIDGQQRISAVVAFMKDEFVLTGALQAAWKGKRFSQLSDQEQDRIRAFAFSAEVFPGISDAEVLEVFSRLNTYSVKLNGQELRNGKYFGVFKQTVYALAYEHLEFWRKHKLFSERSIARMDEVEMVSELVVAEIDGLQDKKKSLETFYQEKDLEFADREKYVDRFRAVITEISESLDVPLSETEFSRKPLFYSLFTAVYHRMYGLPKCGLARKKAGALTAAERVRIFETVVSLSEAIDNFQSDDDDAEVPEALTPFISASLRQTDNIKPRNLRLEVIYLRTFA